MTISTLQFQAPPVDVPRLLQAAAAHLGAGRLPAAEDLCQQALFRQPGCADALHLLGLLAQRRGETRRAISLLQQAIASESGVAIFHNNLSVALCDEKRYAEAVESARRAVALQPELAEAHHNLARACFGSRAYAVALPSSRRALALKPDYVEAIVVLGNCLADLGETDEAMACFREVLRRQPHHAQAYNNMACIRRDAGELEEAVALLEEAVTLAPDYRVAHQNLARALLLQGDLLRGLAQYEWRDERCSVPGYPEWRGEDLTGRSILLMVEQGLGDTLQFIRYADQVTAKSARVFLACQSPLRRLLHENLPGVQVLAGEDLLPPVDFYAPLLSLPHRFQASLATIPGGVPYLRPDPERVETWRQRLAGDVKFKVGLVWAGSKAHTDDERRSATFAAFAPLCAVPGVSFYNLQMGEPAAEAAGAALLDYTADLVDFAETAALLAQLDLVIAVDTAIVHLAGALGRPVWTLLAFAPDWRWMLNRDDTPWYPTMRLFRQSHSGEWSGPVAQAALALEKEKRLR